MIEVGDTRTLDELIARSLLNDAFVVVQPVDGVITALYRLHGASEAEMWQEVPGTGNHALLRFIYIVDLRDYPQFL